MRHRLITIGILGLLMATAALIKFMYYPRLTGDSAYIFLSLFWVTGLVTAILTFNAIWYQTTQSRNTTPHETIFNWPNRRKNFRVVYPADIRPLLVVEKADNQPRRHLEYRVADLSEGGISFFDDGSLGPVSSISGHLQLEQGDNLRVTGRVIRRLDQRICLQLQRSLAWRTILQEQRRILAKAKSTRA